MDKKAFIKYICSNLLFGLNGIVASHIPMNSYEIVFMRTMTGCLFLLFLFLITGGRFTLKKYPRDLMFIVFSGIAMGTSWMFLYEAYHQIGVSLASLMYYCGPVIVMILSPIMFKEKFTFAKVAGFLIVVVGVVLVNGEMALSGGSIWGLICGGMSAVTYFFMVTLNKKSTHITGMENSVLQLAVSFLTVAIFIGIKQRFVMTIVPQSIIWILILGVLNTGIGCYLYFAQLSKLPVQTLAVFGYTELVSAIIFAAIFLGEHLSFAQIIGALCIIGGAMLGELLSQSKIEV